MRDPRGSASHDRDGSAIVYARSRRLDRGARARPQRTRISRSSTTTPASSRASGRGSRTTSSQAGSAGGRRDDRVRDGHRQARRAPRLPRQLPGLARELRPDGRSRAAGTASRARRCCSRARPMRPPCDGSRSSDIPDADELRAVYRAIRDAQRRSSSLRSSPLSCRPTTLGFSSGCSSRPVSFGAATTRAG